MSTNDGINQMSWGHCYCLTTLQKIANFANNKQTHSKTIMATVIHHDNSTPTILTSCQLPPNYNHHSNIPLLSVNHSMLVLINLVLTILHTHFSTTFT